MNFKIELKFHSLAAYTYFYFSLGGVVGPISHRLTKGAGSLCAPLMQGEEREGIGGVGFSFLFSSPSLKLN